MEPVYIIGNSIVEYLEVEGTTKVCRGGATLHRLKPEIERRDGVKLIVAGIPDLFERGSSVVVGPLVDIFEKDLEVVSAMPGVVLCPIYPVRSMVQRQWGIILRLNHLICRLNARKGEGTPAITTKIIGRQRDGAPFFNAARLRDEAHPGRELAEEMSGMLKEWLDRRRRRTDLRERIGRRTEDERADEEQQEAALDIMVNREDRRLVTEDEREGMEVDEDYEEAMERLEREENGKRRAARRERQEREDEIRDRIEQQLQRELRENEERYRRQLDDIRRERDTQEDRLRARRRDTERREEQQRRGREQDRRDREEEPRMRCADVRKDVTRRRDYI